MRIQTIVLPPPTWTLILITDGRGLLGATLSGTGSLRPTAPAPFRLPPGHPKSRAYPWTTTPSTFRLLPISHKLDACQRGMRSSTSPPLPRTKRRPGSINPHLAALLDSRVGTGDAFAGVLEGAEGLRAAARPCPLEPLLQTTPPHHHLDRRHRIRCMPIISLTIIIIIIIILRAAVEPQR